jgi:hypothetical protein
VQFHLHLGCRFHPGNWALLAPVGEPSWVRSWRVVNESCTFLFCVSPFTLSHIFCPPSHSSASIHTSSFYTSRIMSAPDHTFSAASAALRSTFFSLPNRLYVDNIRSSNSTSTTFTHRTMASDGSVSSGHSQNFYPNCRCLNCRTQAA